MSGLAGDTFFLDDFALKVFDPDTASGTSISFDKADFVRIVHEHHAKVCLRHCQGLAHSFILEERTWKH